MTLDLAAEARHGSNSAPLIVAINAQLDPGRAGGVETALNALVAHLAPQAGDERFLLLSTPHFHDALAELAGESYGVVAWPYPQKALPSVRRLTPRWQQWRSKAGLLGPGVNAVHWALWNAHRLAAPKPDSRKADAFLMSRGATVVHFAYPTRFGTSVPSLYEPWDLQHRHYPEFFEPAEWRARDEMYRAGCESATLVVAAARWTKRDIVEQYGIPPGKIAVIPRGPATSRPIPPADAVERLRRDLDLPAHFAFFPAMTFPHKNHLRLLEALATLRDRHGITVPLVCTGRPYEPHWPKIRAAVRQLNLEEQVRMLGAVSEETLAGLFRAASYLMFPSLFEGLGLPVLEALAAGLPVLASDATCLPEVGGDAATYFDATRTDAIMEALLRAERQPETVRQPLQAADAVLARYAWDRAAATFIACYRAVAGAPLSPEQRALYAEALES